MINISELLYDEDFVETVEFGIVSDEGNPFGFDDFFGNLGFDEGRFVKLREPDQDGNPQEFESVYFDWANVQPASGATLQRLPEGERTKPILQVFTRDYMRISTGDYMTYKGSRYRCVTTEDWSSYGYFDSLFVRYSGAQEIDSGGFSPFA